MRCNPKLTLFAGAPIGTARQQIYAGLIPPMAGIIIAATITSGNPMSAAAGRVGIITGNPDPAASDPFMMAGNPNGPTIGRGPATLHDDGRGRGANLDAHTLSGSLVGTRKQHGSGEKRHESQTKMSDFHSWGLDLTKEAHLQSFFGISWRPRQLEGPAKGILYKVRHPERSPALAGRSRRTLPAFARNVARRTGRCLSKPPRRLHLEKTRHYNTRTPASSHQGPSTPARPTSLGRVGLTLAFAQDDGTGR